MTLSDSIYNTCVIDTFVAVPDAQYIEVTSKYYDSKSEIKQQCLV